MTLENVSTLVVELKSSIVVQGSEQHVDSRSIRFVHSNL